jgi:hypothetical protein
VKINLWGAKKRRKMDKKIVGSMLMVGLVALPVIVVFTGAAAGAEMYRIMFEGNITEGGIGVYPANVEITRTDPDTGKVYNWSGKTDKNGYYSTPKKQYLGKGNRAGTYVLKIDKNFGKTLKIRLNGPNGESSNSKSLDDIEIERLIEYNEFIFIENDGYECNCYLKCHWDYHSNGYEIPEFSSIALPIASILGLLFFFNRRKHRKE